MAVSSSLSASCSAAMTFGFPFMVPFQSAEFYGAAGLARQIDGQNPGLFSDQNSGRNQRLENSNAIGAPERGFTRPLGMRHHSENIASRTADTGNIVQRSIRIGLGGDLAGFITVAKDNAIIPAEFGKRSTIAKIVAFHVADRNAQHVTFAGCIRVRRVSVFHADVDRFAYVLKPSVTHKRPGKQTGLAQNLESITNSQDHASAVGELS